ncbi:MAG TPA: O-antigen ligase [Caulobacteraceae bacterium]|nr:O-antigen ligase [Caulobacteraceae bacterium]
MTVIAGAFPRARPTRWSFIETAAFAAAVFMILTYSQGWELPLSGGGDESGDSALIRTLFLPAYAAGVALVALTPWDTVRGLARQPFLIVIFAIAALSMFWSVSPDQTQRRIFALAFTTLGGVVLAARYSWARLAEVIGAAFVVLAVCSLFTGLFVPAIGRMADIFPGAWRGLWVEKNTFGDNMAQGAAICAAAALLNPKRATLWWAASALCFMLVLMSTSKTSLVSVVLSGAAIGLVWAVRRGPASSVAATWTAVVALGAAAAVIFFASDLVFGLLGKDATLTGRTKIWAGVMRQINERPWQGFGYAAIWDETDQWGPLAWITHDAGFRAHHAHNSWLEQWLSLGVPGLAAWAAFYLQTLVANIVALYRDKGAYLALPFFVLYSLTSLTESIAVVYNDMRWVIFVALAVKLALPDAAPTRALASPQVARLNHPRQKSQ